jgi:hypothetical protein
MDDNWTPCERLLPAPFSVVVARLPDGTELRLGYAVFHDGPPFREWRIEDKNGNFLEPYKGETQHIGELNEIVTCIAIRHRDGRHVGREGE